MSKKKKNLITTAESLRLKSDAAITAFKSLISGLKTTNEEAETAKAQNNAQIAVLQQENAAIDVLSKQNAKIIQNIENLINV